MTIDEFMKVELRVGTVVSAEKVEGSDKLLKLMVDLGGPDAEHPEVRQILSGIGKSYLPESLVGRQVALVANLEPREMMGMVSQGMVLAAIDAEGKAVVLSPEREVPPGAEVR